jgi:hypothetical protein
LEIIYFGKSKSSYEIIVIGWEGGKLKIVLVRQMSL